MGPDAITPEVIVSQGEDSSASGNAPRESLSQSISAEMIDNKGGSSSSRSIMVDGVISQLSEGSDENSDGHDRGAGGSRAAEEAEIMEDGEACTVNEDLGNGPVNGGGEGNGLTAAQDELGEKVNALENTEHVEISKKAMEDPSTGPGKGGATTRRAPTMKKAAHLCRRGLRLKGTGQTRAYLVELIAQDVCIKSL